MATTTLDQKIDELTKRKAAITQSIAYISADIAQAQTYVKKMVAEGNYVEANKSAAGIEVADAQRRGLQAELTSINEMLPLLIEQKGIQLTAQTAVVNQVNAQSANTLTPDQQLQLALAKIESEKAAGTRSSNEAQTQDAQKAAEASNKKNYIIGAVVAVVIIVIVIVLSRKK